MCARTHFARERCRKAIFSAGNFGEISCHIINIRINVNSQLIRILLYIFFYNCKPFYCIKVDNYDNLISSLPFSSLLFAKIGLAIKLSINIPEHLITKYILIIESNIMSRIWGPLMSPLNHSLYA